MRSQPIVASIAMLTLVLACDQQRPTESDDDVALGRSNTPAASDTGSSGGPPPPGSPPDTGGTPGSGGPPPPPPPPGPDTSSSYTGLVRVTVTVVSATRNPQSGGSDTLNLAPLAGARVEVQGILQLSQSAQSGTTDANGVFVVAGLPVGPYAVRITPPVGSGLSPATGNVTLNQAEVALRFTLFR